MPDLADLLNRTTPEGVVPLTVGDLEAVARRRRRRRRVSGATAAATLLVAGVVARQVVFDSEQQKVVVAYQTPSGIALTEPVGQWIEGTPWPLEGRRTDMAHSVLSDGRVLVWGGSWEDHRYSDGAIYDPARDKWESIPDAPPAALGESPRWAVQDDRLVVVSFGDQLRLSGALYDVASSTWSSLPVDDEILAHADGITWDGETVAVVRMTTGGVGYLDYDHLDWRVDAPATRRWTIGDLAWQPGSPSPTGLRNLAGVATASAELVLWGGTTQNPWGSDEPVMVEPSTLQADGALYDAVRDRWQTLPPAPAAGVNGSVGWIDGQIVVGSFSTSLSSLSEVDPRIFALDLIARSWTTLPPPPTGGGGVNHGMGNRNYPASDSFLVRHSLSGRSGPQPLLTFLDGVWEEAPLQDLHRWGDIVIATSATRDNPDDDPFEVQMRAAPDEWVSSAPAPFPNRLGFVELSENTLVVIGGLEGRTLEAATQTWLLSLDSRP